MTWFDTPPPQQNSLKVRIIEGSVNAKHFKSPSTGKFYIRTGAFKSANNARNYQTNLSTRVHYPVYIETRERYHIVVVGPMQTAAEVRAVGRVLGRASPANQQVTGTVSKNYPTAVYLDKDGLLDPGTAPNHFEVIGAVGVGNLMPGSGLLGVTSNETDFLVQPNGNNWNTFAGQAGIGYVYYRPGALQYSDKAQWFTAIEPEVNGYYLGQGNFTGDVYRFNSPAFNEMTYSMSLQSARVMVDGALTIASKKKYALYAIGGVGNAWNILSYSDTYNNAANCPDQGLNLGSHTNSNFAWEVGGGVTYTYNPRILLSVEYLYADLGTATTGQDHQNLLINS